MNTILIIAGAAVLVVYLAGRKTAQGIAEPPVWGDPGSAPPPPDGYYDGTGGGDGSISLGGPQLQGPPSVAPNDSQTTPGGLSLINPTVKANTVEAQKQAFVNNLFGGGVSANGDTSDTTRSSGLSYGGGDTRSALVQSQAAGAATPLANSTLSMSRPVSTLGSPTVVSKSVAMQPIRTTSAAAARVSASSPGVKPVPSPAPMPSTTTPAPMTARAGFVSTIKPRTLVRK